VDAFNYLAVLISIILGLGIAQLLSGFGRWIEQRRSFQAFPSRHDMGEHSAADPRADVVVNVRLAVPDGVDLRSFCSRAVAAHYVVLACLCWFALPGIAVMPRDA
jgi:hypothetical protein